MRVVNYLKASFRRFEIWLGVDKLVTRYLHPFLRKRLVPSYHYYSSHPRTFRCDGLNWCIDPSHHVQHRILVGESQTVVDAFVKYVQRDNSDTRAVLDVGANTGGVALRLAKLSSIGSVHAFEPQPRVFARLLDQLTLNPTWIGKVFANQIALGALPGTQALSVPHRSDGLASLARSYIDEPREEISIKVSTVDHYVGDRNLAVSFLKIDVEGFEEEVLRGAERVLALQRPVIFCEMKANGAAARFLKEHGYKLVEEGLMDCVWLPEGRRA